MVEVLRDIGKIARALDSIANIEFKEFDLTRGQYIYLVRIFEHPGIIQEKLAEQIKVDRSTAARAIKKLEKNGFIEKREDPDNRKNKMLYPTSKGKSVAPIILKENAHSNRVALSGFSSEEAACLANYLDRVQHNIEKDWSKVKKGERRLYIESEEV